MALILGIWFFHIRVIREIRGSAAFWNLTIEICLGFGTWDLGFRAATSAQNVDEP